MDAGRVNAFLVDFTAWAQAQPDVLAVALVGSYARSAAGPGSDVDLVLITTRPADYLADLSWTLAFGEVREHGIEDYGKLSSVRAWYGDGLEVEYGITDEDWTASPLDEGTRKVITDGMLILYEKDDLLSRHQPAPESRKPSTKPA